MTVVGVIECLRARELSATSPAFHYLAQRRRGCNCPVCWCLSQRSAHYSASIILRSNLLCSRGMCAQWLARVGEQVLLPGEGIVLGAQHKPAECVARTRANGVYSSPQLHSGACSIVERLSLQLLFLRGTVGIHRREACAARTQQCAGSYCSSVCCITA